MHFFELMILAISLSMDAFAVALCQGLALKQCRHRDMILVGGYFGLFQALMPLLGYFVGSHFSVLMAYVDGFIPPFVLGIIGIQMLKESQEQEDTQEKTDRLPPPSVLLSLAVATSIDAFAVGVTFVVLAAPILSSCLVIGIVTFFFSSLGVQVGHLFGVKYKTKAELFGGFLLLAMAVRFFIVGNL